MFREQYFIEFVSPAEEAYKAHVKLDRFHSSQTFFEHLLSELEKTEEIVRESNKTPKEKAESIQRIINLIPII